jgi:hypothetical protein
MLRFAEAEAAANSANSAARSGDDWTLAVVSTVLRNVCLRADAHPTFVAEGGVEVLVRLIEFQANRKIQRLAVAALADIIPFYTVKAVDDPKFDRQVTHSAPAFFPLPRLAARLSDLFVCFVVVPVRCL